jgi:hypothetical protein
MERPQGRIEQPTDKYDYELTQLDVDAIALADELLKKKPEGSPLTFVDIVLQNDRDQMLEEIQHGPFSQLLAAPDEQLAMASNGEYYPILDVRKENGRLIGMGLRVWGWEHDKVRYTKPENKKPPFKYKEYPGEKDQTRQLEIAMSYQVGRETVTEEISLYFGTISDIRASSQLHMMAYAEMGYEGHGGKSMKKLSDEQVYWFLDFIARHVGDEPKSVGELQDEKIAVIRAEAESQGVLVAIDELINGTWSAQALYIMGKPCKMLDGKSILQALKSPDTAVQAGEAARDILAHWKKGTWGECFVKKSDADE